MSSYNHQQWMKYLRRHEANVFNAMFYDKENVTEDDVQRIIADVSCFFSLPQPEVSSKCESFAEVLLGDKASECELSYNLEMLQKVGIYEMTYGFTRRYHPSCRVATTYHPAQ